MQTTTTKKQHSLTRKYIMAIVSQLVVVVIVAFVLLLAATSASSAYEYNSGYYGGGGRSYRYVAPSSSYNSNSNSLPVRNFNYEQTGGGDDFRTRYYGPTPGAPGMEYQGVPTDVVKNRRRNFAASGTDLPRGSYNEPESNPPPAGGSRWYSSLKRKAPPPSLQVDQHNRVQMGVENSMCDDAKTNLTVDWNLSPINYTCFHPETRFPRSFDAQPLMECESLPPRYVPGHVCMHQTIEYKDLIPTHGDHRPLWPKFGEYTFVPRERWLHNIEHGAVVMLYHPCAYPSEVNRLKEIVKGCVGKHVITPSTYLSPERPLALVAWGCRLLMSAVDDELTVKFIEARAHKGPEGTYTKEGQYDLGLLQSGKVVGNGAKYGYSKVTCDTIDRSRM